METCAIDGFPHARYDTHCLVCGKTEDEISMKARIVALEKLALLLWDDYLEYDDCAPQYRLELMDEILAKRKNDATDSM